MWQAVTAPLKMSKLVLSTAQQALKRAPKPFLSWQSHGAWSVSGDAQVDDSPPQMQPDGQVFNAPSCKLALTQSQTDTMWSAPSLPSCPPDPHKLRNVDVGAVVV